MTAEIERQALYHHHQLQPPRRLPSSACDLHPGETVTGFCASCLRERLSGLEAPAGSAGRKSTSSLRSVFHKVASGAGPAAGSSFLRRSKSSSFVGGDGADGFSAQRPPAAAFEPQRKSCDVRGRSTLWSLFNQTDSHCGVAENPCAACRVAENPCAACRVAENPCAALSASTLTFATANAASKSEAESRNIGIPFSNAIPPSSETCEAKGESNDEIKPADPLAVVVGSCREMNEERKLARAEDITTELKPIKDHIDLDSQPLRQQAKKPPPKDLKEIANSFWFAASVFSKKLQKWRRKQKLKKQSGDATVRTEKPAKLSRMFRDTQSEVAVNASGRRSCDTDPRFSLDAGRVSFDDTRFSWDEPRASWDGYLIGGRSVFPRMPSMLAVVEDAPSQTVQRSDYLIPVEEDATTVPGGSSQTRDYYLDSSCRRRRSLDRSASIREQPLEASELKPVPNGKVSLAGGMEFYQFNPTTLLDRDVQDWSTKSMRDDYLGSFESGLGDQRGGAAKKSRRWSKAWNIWGLIQRRNSSRGESNIVERALSESWPELRSRGLNNRMLRSNSSVSSRNSFSGNAEYRGIKKNSTKSSNHYSKNRRDEFVLERNRSARYSPNNHLDNNGMLRFYLTPMRNSRRNSRGRQISSRYLTRSMLGLF